MLQAISYVASNSTEHRSDLQGPGGAVRRSVQCFVCVRVCVWRGRISVAMHQYQNAIKSNCDCKSSESPFGI
jgi:hypothetical protein